MPNYRFLDYELSESDFCLTQGGRRIALEPKALRVLTLLVSRAGRLVAKQELLQSVWPDTFVEENTLARTIAILRRELGDSSRDSKLIETVPTRGYRFVAAVEVLEPVAIDAQKKGLPGGAGGRAQPEEQTEAQQQQQTLPESNHFRVGVASGNSLKVRDASWHVLPWLLLAVCVAFAGVLFLVWTYRHRPPVEGPIRSLAVLPLEDLSPGDREDYFADGMTGELITELARLPGLRVVSRTSVMQDKGVRKPLRQIAEELQVDAVVEGDVVRSAGRVRITAQLIDARSDKHLWARTFEGPLGDVLTLQDDVARDIALQTSSILSPAVKAELGNGKHVSPDAHDDYLRGLYFIQRRDGALAATYLRKATELAPEYGAAWAGLAEALVTEVLANDALANELMPQALMAANRAIVLDPKNGASYTALGAIDATWLWDWDGAERNLRRGVELSPSDANAQIWYAVYLTSTGKPADAVITMQRAVTLDPLSFWVNRLLGSVLYYAGRYDDSLTALKRASELAPDKFRFVEGWSSMIYELRGRYSDALDADLRESPELTPSEKDTFRASFELGGWQGYQQARVKYLLMHSEKLCRMNSLAMTYVRLGNQQEAFRWFHRELDRRCGKTIFDLASDPRLNPIRADPRFRGLLERAHLAH